MPSVTPSQVFHNIRAYHGIDRRRKKKRKKKKKNPFNAQHNRTTPGWVSTPLPTLLHCLTDPLNILPLIVLIKVRSLDIGRARGIGVVQETR